MQFSDTTNKNGVIQMIERTTNLGDAAISGTAAELAYFTNLVNQWVQVGHFYAWTVDKDWDFDDSNQTTFPFATTTLVNSQRDYTLPSSLYRIKSVEILDANGKYFEIKKMSNESDVLYTQREQEPAGIPSGYRMVGRSIKLYPKPDTSQVTAAAGIRVRIDRKMDLFTVADTTQEPGFIELLHPICYYGPSWEWAMVNNVGNIAQMCERMLGQWPGLREIFEKYFSLRDQNDKAAIRRMKVSYK